jgi:DegV family protein with EDD domain
MSTAVLTDSTSDLTPEEQERFGVRVIPLNVAFQGKIFLDHQTITAQSIFEGVKAGAGLPKTAPPELDRYRQTLDALLHTHEHVFCIHLSSKLSDTARVAAEAASIFTSRVTVLDSQQTSGALAMQAERAARLLQGGIPPKKVAEIFSSLAAGTTTQMGLDTLDYLRLGGRIGAATALLGRLLNLKPIIGVQRGRVVGVSRERGKQAVHKRLARDMVKQIRQNGPGLLRVVISFNEDEEGADLLERTAQAEGAVVLTRSRLGSVLSAHGGPGICGFSSEPVNLYHEFRKY